MQQAATSETPSPVAYKSKTRLAWVGKGFLILLAVGVLFILARNLINKPLLFMQYVVDGLQLGFVYALIALGYTMVYGIVKLINFAHGDIFMVGAFVSYYSITKFNLHVWPAALFPGMPELLVVIIGTLTVITISMLVCVALAVTIERVAYKPLRDAPRIAALITAIGVSFFLEFFGALYFVFSPRFIPYIQPFNVVAYYIAGDGIHQVVQGTQNSIWHNYVFEYICHYCSCIHFSSAFSAIFGAQDEDRYRNARHFF